MFDERFIRRDSSQLCDLTSAADGLEMRVLVDLGGWGLRERGGRAWLPGWWVDWRAGGPGWVGAEGAGGGAWLPG